MRVPHLVLLAVFLLTFTFLGIPQLLAKDSAVSILNLLPSKIAGIPHGKLTTYENPRLGASIPFDGEGLTITVYVYDCGRESIADGIKDPLIQQAIEMAKRDVQESPRYSEVRVTGEEPGKFDSKAATLHAQFEMIVNFDNAPPRPVYSEIHVFGAWNHIFKLRITMDREGHQALGPKVHQFVADLLKAVEFLPPARQ